MVPPRRRCANEIDVEPGLAECRQVRDRGLRAGEDDGIGIARQRCAGTHPDEIDRRFGFQRIEVVEIGDVGQDRHRDPDPAFGLCRHRRIKRERVFGRQQPGIGEERDEAERLPSGRLCDRGHTGGEQFRDRRGTC